MKAKFRTVKLRDIKLNIVSRHSMEVDKNFSEIKNKIITDRGYLLKNPNMDYFYELIYIFNSQFIETSFQKCLGAKLSSEFILHQIELNLI